MWRGVFQAHILLIGGLLYTDPVSAVAGRLLDSEDAPVSGVTVAISEIGQAQVSGPGGKFAFGGLPAGEYTLQLTLGKLPLGERSAEVEAGGTTRIEIRLEDALGYAETLTVQSPSRRVERVIDAPAAVSAGLREGDLAASSARPSAEGSGVPAWRRGDPNRSSPTSRSTSTGTTASTSTGRSGSTSPTCSASGTGRRSVVICWGGEP